MTSSGVDGAAEVRTALRDILREHGVAGLDDAKLVATLLPDLLASSPREAKLILAASSAGVAGILRTRRAQGMTLPAAIRDASVMLAQDSMIDGTVCEWIVTEFASALGYPVATTSMPDPTSAPPARTSDPVRSDPRPPARPLPPTRIAGPAGYPAPGYAPPPGWSPGISPAGFSPAPAPYPARPVYVMPPPPMPPPRRGGGTIVVWVIVVFLLLILGICGGGYAYYNANKVRTQSLAACLTGTWRAQTDQVTVTMADGSDVRTTLTGGTVTREYLSTLDETVHWNTATYSGTYLGKPVTVVYAGSANYPVTTTGTDTIHVTARTIYVNVKLTVNGKTTSQDSVDLTDSSSRASCTDATLIVYNTDNSVRSTWVKLSS